MKGLWILTALLAACHPVAATTAETPEMTEADKNWEAVYGGMNETDKTAGIVLEPAGAEK